MTRDGVSLIELLMALTLLVVGLLALAGLTATSARMLTQATLLDEASLQLEAIVDSARWFVLSGSGQEPRGVGLVAWSLGEEPASEGWVEFTHPALRVPVRVELLSPAAP